MVDARARFADLVRPRPWHRRRRTIVLSVLAVLAALALVLAAVLFLPAFRVQDVQVEGTGYTDPEAITAAADPAVGRSLVLSPISEVQAAAEKVPGVRTAEVERVWPAGLTITVTEREPVATLVRPDGSQVPVDAEGTELPPQAVADRADALPTLTVEPDAEDPTVAAEAMTAVMAALPPDLRARASDVRASTDSDVAFTLTPEEGAAKTVVWGDARDGQLKAKVVATLMSEPGTVIDVSAPVAPVTR